jgi:predicted RNA binding protein YcfA (HicA-like mRNA interferase family)
MPRLPRISAKAVIKKLEHAGYYEDRQKRSHIWLKHPTRPPTTIPLHDIIGPGLLRQILRETELTLQEFLDL